MACNLQITAHGILGTESVILLHVAQVDTDIHIQLDEIANNTSASAATTRWGAEAEAKS